MSRTVNEYSNFEKKYRIVSEASAVRHGPKLRYVLSQYVNAVNI